MFRRGAAAGTSGTKDWPVANGVSGCTSSGTRTSIRFYTGDNPPALLSSTPGSGTTGTASMGYGVDIFGGFYVEGAASTTLVLGWRNAGAWSRQTITVPTNSLGGVQKAQSNDGSRIYFRTDAGISEWSLNRATRVATKVVDAAFASPDTGGTTAAYGVQWVAPDTLILHWQRVFGDSRLSARTIQKQAGTWVSVATHIEATPLTTPSNYEIHGPLYFRSEAGGTSLRLVPASGALDGPVLLSARSIFTGSTAGTDGQYAYIWRSDSTTLYCTRVGLDGSGETTFSVAHGISGAANFVSTTHPLDGGLCSISSISTGRFARCTSTGITLRTVSTTSPAWIVYFGNAIA